MECRLWAHVTNNTMLARGCIRFVPKLVLQARAVERVRACKDQVIPTLEGRKVDTGSVIHYSSTEKIDLRKLTM